MYSKLKNLYLYFDKKLTTNAITGLYFTVGIIGIRIHEMWRDEAQAWLIARDSQTIVDVFQNLRHEGHPPLWHLLLFIISRFTGNPIYMQLTHVLIATACVYIFTKFAPFTKLQKVFFSFSYIIIYEFGIIARNYNLSILFIFIYCYLITKVRKNYYLLGLVLFILSQTNVMGALMVIPLVFYTFWDYISLKNKNLPRFAAFNLISLFGLIIFYIQVKLLLPNDGTYVPFRLDDIRNTIASIWQGLVPIPADVVSFWNTNIVNELDARVGLSVALLIIIVVYFSKNFKVLSTFIVGSISFLSFFYYVSIGGMRNHGFWMILFIVCVWFLNFDKLPRKSKTKQFSLYQAVFLWTLLIFQFIAGGVSFYKEKTTVFSRAELASNYIKDKKLQGLPIVSGMDYQASSLISYLNKRAFFPQTDEWGSYVKWNDKRLDFQTDDQLIIKSNYIAKELNSDVLLISSTILLNNNNFKNVEFLHEVSMPAVIADEIYYIYIVYHEL